MEPLLPQSGSEIASIHVCHSKAQTVVPIQRISKQMRCHKEGKYDSEDPNIMLHPANGEAWQAVNRFDLEFARDHMSVCLGFSTHGFQPHNTDSSMYFCCPVFIMPYNLPLKKYLK
jgi:hypothetical protein